MEKRLSIAYYAISFTLFCLPNYQLYKVLYFNV